MLTADEMREQAIATADAARYQKRSRFDVRWACFAKCDRCGARFPGVVLLGLGKSHAHPWPDGPPCGGTFRLAGYSAPWWGDQ